MFSRLTPVISNDFYLTEPEIFFIALYRLSKETDPLQILRLAEEDEGVPGIKKGFTDMYISKNKDDRRKMLISINSFILSGFTQKILQLNIDSYSKINDFIDDSNQRNDRSRISIVSLNHDHLVSVGLHRNIIKDRFTKLITLGVLSDDNDLPDYLRDYCINRLRYWIDNAFLAKEMQPGREYIVEGDAIYPVDYKSTGVIETNKKWGDGLQQFLEMNMVYLVHRYP